MVMKRLKSLTRSPTSALPRSTASSKDINTFMEELTHLLEDKA